MSIASRYRNWNQMRRTRAALYSLSNRQLDDLGLCRGDIPSIGIRI